MMRVQKSKNIGLDDMGAPIQLVSPDAIFTVLSRRVLIACTNPAQRHEWYAWRKRFGIIPLSSLDKEYLPDGRDESGQARIHVQQWHVVRCSEFALERLRLVCPSILLNCSLTDGGIVVGGSGAGDKPGRIPTERELIAGLHE